MSPDDISRQYCLVNSATYQAHNLQAVLNHLTTPLRQLVKPFIGCFIGKSNNQSRAAATSEVSEAKEHTTVPVAEAFLVPEYEGPILNPASSNLLSPDSGPTLLDCFDADCKVLSPMVAPLGMSASLGHKAAAADVVSSCEQLSGGSTAEGHNPDSAGLTEEMNVCEQLKGSLPTESVSSAHISSCTQTASALSADASSSQLLSSTAQAVSPEITDKPQTDSEECTSDTVSMLAKHKVVDTLVEDLVGDAVEYASLQQGSAAHVVTALPAPKDTVSQTEVSQHGIQGQEAAAQLKDTTDDIAPKGAASQAQVLLHDTQAQACMTLPQAVNGATSGEPASGESASLPRQQSADCGEAPLTATSAASSDLPTTLPRKGSQLPTAEESWLPTVGGHELPTVEEPQLPTLEDSDLPTMEEAQLPTDEEVELPSPVASISSGSSAAKEVQADMEQVQAPSGEQASRVIVGGGWWQDRAAFEEMVKAVPTDPSQVTSPAIELQPVEKDTMQCCESRQ